MSYIITTRKNLHKIKPWKHIECVFIHIIHVYIFDTSEMFYNGKINYLFY